MKIFCPSKIKVPYKAVIDELALRARVDVEFVKKVPGNKFVILDEAGEPATIEKISELVVTNVDILIGGPDGTDIEGPKISLGNYTLNHQIAIIVLLDLLFRVKYPNHPYNKH